MNDYDQAARKATEQDHHALFTRLGELAKIRWSFQEWAPTQTTPNVGDRDQISDKVATLKDTLEKLWLSIVEFQSAHEEDKLADLFGEVGQFLRSLRVWPVEKRKQAILPCMVYLFGDCPEEQRGFDMRSPAGLGVTCSPVFWFIANDNASEMLDRYEQKTISWGILFWIPLMLGADDVELVRRWLRIVEKLPETQQADLKAIARVFAALAKRGPVWVLVLEESIMGESPVINEWRRQGAEKGEIDGTRKALLGAVKRKWKDTVAADVIDTINSQTSFPILCDWNEQAAILQTAEEFRAYLRR